MKLKFETTRKEATEIDVEFPVYRQHDVGGDDYSCVIYTRIEFKEAGLTGPIVTQYSVKHSEGFRRRSESFELEIETVSMSGGDSMDYILGRGEYACTRDEFDEVAEKAVNFLRRLRGGPA